MVLELLRTPRYSIAKYEVRLPGALFLGEIQRGQRLRELFSHLPVDSGVVLDLPQTYQPGIDAFMRWGVEDYLEGLFAQDEMYKPLLLRSRQNRISVHAIEYSERDLQLIAAQTKKIQAFIESILDKNPLPQPHVYHQIAVLAYDEMRQFPQLRQVRRLQQFPEKAKSSMLVECPALFVPWLIEGFCR